jgi:HAMP domain.
VIITALAGNFIYDNLGVLVSAIADAMTRLTKGERTVRVPALHRQDELGDLARAFNVFANNAASLARVTKLFKEKASSWKQPFFPSAMVLRCLMPMVRWWYVTRSTPHCCKWSRSSTAAISVNYYNACNGMAPSAVTASRYRPITCGAMMTAC